MTPDDRPRDVTEVEVPPDVWDGWTDGADRAQERGDRTRLVLGIVVTVAVVLPSLLLLDAEPRLSALLWAPLMGWAAGEAARRAVRRLAFRPVAHEVRTRLCPPVPGWSTFEMMRLVENESYAVSPVVVRSRREDHRVVVEVEQVAVRPPTFWQLFLGHADEASGG